MRLARTLLVFTLGPGIYQQTGNSLT